MPAHSTKLKLGRKLDGVDTATASDNQASVLFRYDEEGREDHVSISIESDAMTAEDVFALLNLLHDRGVLTAGQCKTWLNQPTASVDRFGETTTWAGEDLQQRVSMLAKGLKVRAGGNGGAGGGAAAKLALLKVAEVETKLDELKRALRGNTGEEEAEAVAPGTEA